MRLLPPVICAFGESTRIVFEDKPIHLVAAELTTPAKCARSLLRSQCGNHRPGTNR
jgi:hypothetical protein